MDSDETRCGDGRHGALEIELVDILFGECERLPENNGVAVDRQFTESTGFQRFVAGFELCLAESVRRVDSEVTEIPDFPEDNRLRDAFLHIGPVFARQSEPDHFDRAGPARLL